MGGRPVAVGLGVASFILWASLFSHSSRDGNFWNATSDATSNWFGAFGANLSCALLYAFGNAAFLIPLALAIWVWRLWSGHVERRVMSPLRLGVASVLGLLAASAFLSAVPGKMTVGTGYGGFIGDRLILPFARIFDNMGFDAPYQIPGLLLAIGALVGLGVSSGMTKREASMLGRQGAHKIQRTVSRERRRALADSVMTRASDLTTRLRTRTVVPERPMSLRGDSVDPVARSQSLRGTPLETAGKKQPKAKKEPAAAKKKVAKNATTRSGSQDLAPDLNLLSVPQRPARPMSEAELQAESVRLLQVLNDFGVKGEMKGVSQGPVITLHEFEPAPGVKVSRVVSLAEDIALNLGAQAVRVAPVKERSVIGIELPNSRRETIFLKEIMEPLLNHPDPLPVALGKAIDGTIRISSLAKMPHLLVAGTTGSGKSVGINALILSLLYRHPPSECRMIMIDPKMLELSVYDGIPHLLSPVVTDPKKAVMALKWVVREMEDRYRKMADMNVRNLAGYNARMEEAIAANETLRRNGMDEVGEPTIIEYQPEKLPFIVVIVDEMADLMMTAGKEVEACIMRLAQMARASGIHIVMATQRPSTDIITGAIKANFPTRISFQVTSAIDSRTILNEMGAEQLLGMGDMLFQSAGKRSMRVHGPFVSDEEVRAVADDLRAMSGEANDQVEFEELEGGRSDIDEILGLAPSGGATSEDALYDQAVAIVARDQRATISYIQRRLQIGYNKAARLIEQMEENGVVTPANNAGKREILIGER
jgi:S-DNA-T family DNA segregation ATPase FtsK/SpoIIIE